MPSGSRVALIPIAAWVLIYPWRSLHAHFALESNAFDLSVFDYALWSTSRGDFGQVPFIGHSLFSHHFMPALLALVPAYAAWSDPVILIGLQLAAFLVAAVLLARLAGARVSPLMSVALVTAFCFSRRAHSALASPFYPESLEPALMLGALLAWQQKHLRTALVLAVIALGCKEDVAIYFFGFGVAMAAAGDRTRGLRLAAAAAIWFLAAMFVAIPFARSLDGPSVGGSVLAARYGIGAEGVTIDAAIAAAGGRLLSWHSLSEVSQLLAITAMMALASPLWLLAVLPGVLANVIAQPGSLQSALLGHYFWPVAALLFWASIGGAERLERLWPRLAQVAAIALLALTVADSPLWQSASRSGVPAERAAAIRQAIAALPVDAGIAVTTNLVPHLPHTTAIKTIGRNEPALAPPLVVLSPFGDTWPLTNAQVTARIFCLKGRAGLEVIADGDVTVFRRTGDAVPLQCP